MLNKQKFWNNAEMVRVEEQRILTDGCMADLNSDGIDFSKFIYIKDSTFAKVQIASPECTNRLVFQDERRDGLYLYRFMMKESVQVLIQKKYAEYFSRVYPGCEFYIQNNPNGLVRVIHDDLIVGYVMPVNLII